jgi:hypothetical protein
MKDHLDDVEFAAALAGDELAGEVAEHLGTCVSCRRQLAGMRGWIEERRDRAERDAPDWKEQLERISARLDGVPEPRRHRRWLRPAVAAAALIAVAVGVGILQQRQGDDVRGDLTVEEILAETDALLADDSIPGFEVIDPGLEGLREDPDNGVS